MVKLPSYMVIKIQFHFILEKRGQSYYLKSKPNSIIMLHNHPGQSGFSLNDISLFIRLNSIKSITIVTNYGKTKYLTKGENYSKEAALSLYKNC